jgi:hypothetical protein
LRELADDADYSRKYAEAYVDAYQALSERGVGLLGKHNSTFRSLKELQHKVKTKQNLEKLQLYKCSSHKKSHQKSWRLRILYQPLPSLWAFHP